MQPQIGASAVSRYVGLLFAIVCILVMAVLSFTPLVWHQMGQPNESYPELVYLVFGMPISFIMFVVGLAFALHGASTRLLKTLQFSQRAACVLLCVAAVSPWLS